MANTMSNIPAVITAVRDILFLSSFDFLSVIAINKGIVPSGSITTKSAITFLNKSNPNVLRKLTRTSITINLSVTPKMNENIYMIQS